MQTKPSHRLHNLLIVSLTILISGWLYLYTSPDIQVAIHSAVKTWTSTAKDFVLPYAEILMSRAPDWFGPQMYTNPDYAILAFGGTFFLIVMYLIPTLLVLRNTKKIRRLPTFLVNLFFGWTIIGWFIALSMAVSNDRF